LGPCDQANWASKDRASGAATRDPHRSFLIEQIEQDGDMTMPELAGALSDATGVRAPGCNWPVPSHARIYV